MRFPFKLTVMYNINNGVRTLLLLYRYGHAHHPTHSPLSLSRE